MRQSWRPMGSLELELLELDKILHHPSAYWAPTPTPHVKKEGHSHLVPCRKCLFLAYAVPRGPGGGLYETSLRWSLGNWPGHQRHWMRIGKVAIAMRPRTRYGEAFEVLWRTSLVGHLVTSRYVATCSLWGWDTRWEWQDLPACLSRNSSSTGLWPLFSSLT